MEPEGKFWEKSGHGEAYSYNLGKAIFNINGYLRYPVRKLPEANGNTLMDFGNFVNFHAKNCIFSIFFKLSQVLYNGVKMVPRCFVTLKATHKACENILESFEKKFLSNF